MFWQSANSCVSRNRTALGVPVVPDVIFKRFGLRPSQQTGERSKPWILFERINPCACVRCRILSNWAAWRSASIGVTTRPRSQQASRIAGQHGSFPIAATRQSPAENADNRVRHAVRSSSISRNVRRFPPLSEKIAVSRLLLFKTCFQKLSKSLCSTCFTRTV